MKVLRFLPSDENQRVEVMELASLTSEQLVQLDRSTVAQGRDAAGLCFTTGAEVGFDTLR